MLLAGLFDDFQQLLLPLIQVGDLLQFSVFDVFLDADEVVFDLTGNETLAIIGLYAGVLVAESNSSRKHLISFLY